ncbi:E3 ubiquitin-protein ligase Bre1-like protein, partial [Leptotrombidium deliense]
MKRASNPETSASAVKKGRFQELPKIAVSTSEELDLNVLKFQNKKLAERLEIRHRNEQDLKLRIEQLEKKQTSAESIVYVINRYWNQLNEDLRVLLQRFDCETSDESEKSNECEATTSFISQLSNWDKEELEENLQKRVYISTRQVGK